MSAITDFRDRLISGSLAFTVGGIALNDVAATRNVFIGLMPVTPDDAVLLVKFPSTGPERVMGTGTAGVVKHNVHIQVQVRARTYAIGEQMMKDIIAHMDNFVGAIGGNTYLWISQRSGVADYGQDENKRFRHVTTFMMEGPIP